MAPGTDPGFSKNRYIVTGNDSQPADHCVERVAGSHDYLIIYTLGGAGRVVHREGRFDLNPHDVVLIEPHHYQNYGTHEKADHWQRLWAHFVPLPSWSLWMNWPLVAEGHRFIRVADPRMREQIIGALSKAHIIASGYYRHREPLALNALESALIWGDEANPEGGLHDLDPRVRQAIDYICRNIDKPLTLADLGKRCGLSQSRLTAIFREQLDLTPHQFLDQQRLTRAKQLIEMTGLTIAEIAYAVGFNSPFYFTRRFTEAYGQSPRAYRAAARS